jgi:transposase
LHCDGQEKLNEHGTNIISITKGYSRDHRPELNQVILNLICKNQADIGGCMKPVSSKNKNIEGYK